MRRTEKLKIGAREIVVKELTMAEIGTVLNLSESRVSQIHKDILQRLRQRFGSSLAEELAA